MTKRCSNCGAGILPAFITCDVLNPGFYSGMASGWGLMA